jgi:hypothetical protein
MKKTVFPHSIRVIQVTSINVISVRCLNREGRTEEKAFLAFLYSLSYFFFFLCPLFSPRRVYTSLGPTMLSIGLLFRSVAVLVMCVVVTACASPIQVSDGQTVSSQTTQNALVYFTMDLQAMSCNEIDAIAISCVSGDSPTHTFQMFVSMNGSLPNKHYPSSESAQYVLFRDTQAGLCLNRTITVGVFSSRPTAEFNLTMSRVTLVSNTEPCVHVLVDLPNATASSSYVVLREPASDFSRVVSLWVNAKEGLYDVGCAAGFPHPGRDACLDLEFCQDFSWEEQIPSLSCFSHSILPQEAPIELFCRITPHSIETISSIEVRNIGMWEHHTISHSIPSK